MPVLGSLAAGSVKGFGAQANLGYFLGQSLRFRASGSSYLERTAGVSPTNNKIMTLSMWVKRGTLGVQQTLLGSPNSGNADNFIFLPSNALAMHFQDTAVGDLTTTQVFRDPSAWYHIVLAIDTTQATASNRAKMYVNGNQITVFSTASYPEQNTVVTWSSTVVAYLGVYVNAAQNWFDGYMGDVYLIDGQALTPSDFGKTDPSTGSWISKKYVGTYGTNGFKLDFKHQSSASGFNTVTYNGNGTSQSITGVGFSPDLVWVKQRSGTAYHNVYDSLRIVSGDHKRLYTNATNAEESSTYSGTTNLTSFDSGGFSVGSGSDTNNSGSTYVAWCWDAGSSTVSNTDGTITSSVRANPATGFSIVTYTGTGSAGTIGHGLSSDPKMILVKKRSDIDHWVVYHESLSSPRDKFLLLSATNAESTLSNYWGTSAWTSGVFGTNSYGGINSSGDTFVAYCFSEVSGYSKFGSYTGNGTSQSINLGFRPAFVMWKRTDAAGNSWIIKDNTRYADNQGNLFPNATTEENTDTSVTFTDTGFDVDSALGYNGSGREFIYMAFADTRDTAFWRDKSGTDNDWTLNAINYAASAETTYDLMYDVPTLTSPDKSNFAVLNPLNKTSNLTLTEANLKATGASSAYNNVYSTFMIPKDVKTYFEVTVVNSLGGGNNLAFYLDSVIDLSRVGAPSGAYGIDFGVTSTYYTYLNGSSTNTGISISNGHTLQMAIDQASGKMWIGINNTWLSSGNPSTGDNSIATISTTTDYFIRALCYSSGSMAFNFGQRPFAYTPPSGYKKLNTYNL
jgi:hypothetical protein